MKEYWEIASLLENHNALFSEFWEMGEPVFTDSINTAAICWNKEGQKINYLFNEEFWNSLNSYQRGFVISHEILHVLFKHGNRLKSIIGNAEKMQIANIAADIIVNEFLFRKFKFHPLFLGDLYEKLITEKSVFEKENDSILTFEIYYALLTQEDSISEMNSIDNHEVSFLPQGQGDNTDNGGGLEDIPDIVIDDIIEQAINKFDEKDAKDLKELCDSKEFGDIMGGQLAGSMSGNLVKVIEKFTKIRKQKWITLVKDWTRRKIKESINETWIWPNRRLTLFKDGDFFLPAEYTEEKEEKDKIDVWLFMDTSGSCAGYATRFFKAAEFIPDDYFNVRLFCFDTQTYETDLVTRKLYGFGGTRFDIIEQTIQKEMKNTKTKKYPDSVWILTDGYGNNVSPQKPERWKWFMTEYHDKNLIPKKSEVYNLSDYE